MTDDDINKRAWRGILIIFALVVIMVLPIGRLPFAYMIWEFAVCVFFASCALWVLLALLGAKLGERYRQQSEPGVSPEPADLPPPTVDRMERETKEIQS